MWPMSLKCGSPSGQKMRKVCSIHLAFLIVSLPGKRKLHSHTRIIRTTNLFPCVIQVSNNIFKEYIRYISIVAIKCTLFSPSKHNYIAFPTLSLLNCSYLSKLYWQKYDNLIFISQILKL